MTEKRVSSPYPITPIAYFKRYLRNVKIHNESQDKSYLLYAALELRFTIESLMFHYLHSLNRGSLSKTQQKLYRPNDLKKEILKADPLFLTKLEFADMCAYYRSVSSKLRPDLTLLSNVHGKLGDWLHAEYSPLVNKIQEQEWIGLAGLFDSVDDHLSLILSHPLLELNLTDAGNALMEEYAKGTISRADVVARMNKEWGLLCRGVTQHILID